MDTVYESSPYFHFITDDFFEKDDLNWILDSSYKIATPKLRKNCIKTNNRQVFDLKWHDIDFERVVAPFKSLAHAVCEQRYPDLIEKFKGPRYIPAAQMQFNPRGWDYNTIHTDLRSKIFTFTVYLSEYGKGTQLFSGPNKEDLVDTVEWKVNRGMGFVRTDDSWHNFGASEEHDRLTITYFYREAEEYKNMKESDYI